jgi:BirA family transcriptional regulator, biotin operon repressor / biotin---[acetyl-CoA-carboxylase] ligase
MDEHILKDWLAGLPVPAVKTFDVIGSTNDEALAWCAQGAADGCLVIADRQTHGRGRLNRRWVTNPGAALAFSVILKPSEAEIKQMALFSPLGAMAISQALEVDLNLQPSIKWPNDVLLLNRKAAGILVEAAWLGDRLQGIVIGIGLNVSPTAVPPEDEVLFPAISVEQAAQHPVDRFQLLRAILEALFYWRARLHTPAFFEGWEKRLAFKNEWVKLSQDGEHAAENETLTGRILGLDESGNLLLQLESGQVKAVSVGDIHLRPFR